MDLESLPLIEPLMELKKLLVVLDESMSEGWLLRSNNDGWFKRVAGEWKM